jgi:hypothetical protein
MGRVFRPSIGWEKKNEEVDMRRALLVMAALALVTAPAMAVYDVIVDDSSAQFLDWNAPGLLQTSATGGYGGGGYHYVDSWGNDDGGNASASERVRYYLPSLPSGTRSYAIYAWSPTAHSTQWHILNVTDNDTTESYPYYAGKSFNNDGGWLQLTEANVDPAAGPDGGVFRLSGDTGHSAYVYIKYQPWYTANIAFDAIRVVEVPEPSVAALLLLGVPFLRRRGR